MLNVRSAGRITVLGLAVSALAFGCTRQATVTTTAPGTGGAGTDAPVEETRISAGRGASTADENVRANSGAVNSKNNPSSEPAPAEKGGATRQSGSYVCAVNFDNYTGLVIETYVDGYYKGMVGRYGNLWTRAEPGPTRLYARAMYDDGSYSYWGPVVISCPSGTSRTWRLNR